METAKRIDDAINFLRNSKLELKEGRIITMDAFQEQVRSICEDLTKISVEDKQFFSEKLEVLADNLRELEVDLRARMAEVNYELMSLNAKQRALKSYETINYVPKKDNDNGN